MEKQKCFHDENRLKKFMTPKPALQKVGRKSFRLKRKINTSRRIHERIKSRHWRIHLAITVKTMSNNC